MNWKIEIPRENYYSKMYDIEELTSLNKKAHRNSSELVAKIEKKIKNNKCTNAIKEIEKISRPNTKLEMLYGALKIKNLILQNKNLSPKKSALLELSKYFKKHTQTIKNKMLVEKPVAEDWKRISPDVNDEDSIVNFYIKTDSYIYELMAANHIIQTLFSYYVLSKKIENKNIKNILDYGAGAGTLCILFKKLGYEITYADLPGKLFDYAKWRFKERCLKVPMINITKGKISKKYDCIISTEVVEHVLRPKDLIQELKKMLKKNGILIISESCSYTKEIIDIYIPKSDPHPCLRIRKNGNEFEITKKKPVKKEDASIQKEQTINLTKEEFQSLEKIDGKRLKKIRYQYKLPNGIAEFDVFQEDLSGLVLIDIEFEAEDTKNDFSMPDFCLADVTQEKFVAGGMLCGKKYEDIENDLEKFSYKKL